MNDEKEIFKESFPSNSKSKKVERVTVGDVKQVQTKKVEKVVVGAVKQQKKGLGKKMAELLLEDDTKSVGSYIFHDVLIPAGKSMICDIVGWGGFAEMMLFGDRRGSRNSNNIRRDGNRTIVNYGSYSNNSSIRQTPRGDVRDPRQQRDLSRVSRSRHDFGEIVLETRGEAEDVLALLADLVVEYEIATVSDLYDAVGITPNFTDEKYGWVDLRGASVSRVRNGYLLNLPRPQPID